MNNYCGLEICSNDNTYCHIMFLTDQNTKEVNSIGYS